MNNNRYSRDEISNILKRAAELEHKDNIEDNSDGLTIAEVEQVSKEVWLHPRYIQQAVNDLALFPMIAGGWIAMTEILATARYYLSSWMKRKR